MRNLLLLIDSRKYVASHPYQHQLLATLRKHYDVTTCSLRELHWFPLSAWRRYDVVLSSIRQRALVNAAKPIARAIGRRSLFVYDEDVWEGFREGSPSNRCYARLSEKLNVAGFLVTSSYWCERVRRAGFPAHPVRIGMLPEYCNAGPDWSSRPIRLGFQGSIYPHRQEFFDQLAALGFHVALSRSAPFLEFLQKMHETRIFIHSETSHNYPNSRWNKVAEAVARGAFVVRNYEPEADAFEVRDFPAAFTFRKVAEVPEIIHHIENMSDDERRNRVAASVDAVRRRNDWQTVVRALQPA